MNTTASIWQKSRPSNERAVQPSTDLHRVDPIDMKD
jgi:hypothetical protein